MEIGQELIKFFINKMKEHVGRKRSISIDELKMYFRNSNKRVPVEKIKELVHHVRTKEQILIGSRKLFLMSDSNSLWLSKDIEELENYAATIERRYNETLTIKQAINRYLAQHRPKPDSIENQTNLF